MNAFVATGLIRRAAAVLGMASCLGAGVAQQVPDKPELRIETGAHLSQITRIATDQQGRWVLTVAEDKTARLWEGSSGRLLSVLRPPIGAGEVGNLYAAALSPDGRQAAVGGNAAFEGASHAFYLFDRATGRLPPKSTLSGLEAPITQLAWSQDSEFIAVGLRQTGLRVFRRDLRFVGSDPEYNEPVYGAAFSSDGRLATASPDGAVRLYRIGADGLQRVARKLWPSGRPYAVAFSPDGGLIAVGRLDAARIDVLDGRSLETLYAAEVSVPGNLAKVAWSADGRTLFGGGSAVVGNRFQLYAFADRGRGAGRPIGSFSNTLTSLAPLAGGVVAASAEPSWASFDAAGSQYKLVGPQGADFRDAGESFRVADDGQRVIFPMARGGRELMRFDMARGELAPAASARELNGPRMPRAGAGPDDWRNSATPRVGGRALPLRDREISRSVAVAPGGARFVLGTEWYLRAFDRSGAGLWETRTPGPAWAVNVTGDGRWVLAGLGDGSIRWYRMDDGREQMALFVHADRTRWILWSDSGYYDTSIGGEGLVGWHLNRALNEAADFFPVGRFRDRFYRPDVLQKLLRAGDEQLALSQARADLAALQASGSAPDALAAGSAAPRPETPPVTQLLPPVLELRSDRELVTRDPLVPIRYAVRTPADAPIQDLKVRVNGRLERNFKSRMIRGTGSESDVHELVVPVPPRDSKILLIARNRNANSEPVTISVRRGEAGSQVPIETYDTLYMVVIGVDKYPGDNELELPVKDANDFRSQMTRAAQPPQGRPKLYERLEYRFLADEQATREGVLQGLKWLQDSVKERDVGIVFIAGHGLTQNNTYYFVPYKADGLARGPDEWVAGNEIVAALQNLPGRAIFFLDTCHSGALANMARVTDTINKVEEERGVIVFASSTAREQSQEDKKRWNNGAFTKAIIEGLRGGADYRNEGVIYPSLLKNYVTLEVRKMTNGQQRPYANDQSIDEPIAITVR